MKNKLSDLNNYLFEILERITDNDIPDDELQKEITRSQAVTSVATTIIQNAELALKTLKLLNEYGIETSKENLPAMLDIGKKE